MPLTEKDGKVSERPGTPNRETAAKGEKLLLLCFTVAPNVRSS